MIDRRAWLRWALAGLATSLPLVGSSASAAKAKKKRKEDPDGQNTFAGAIWEFAAIHSATGETFQFRFRAADGVFYNDDNEVIGTTQLKKKNVATLTFNKLSPAEGVYKVKLQRVGHWTGEHKEAVGQWALRLTCIDR